MAPNGLVVATTIMVPADLNSPINFEPSIRGNVSCADFAQPKSHLSVDQATKQTIELRPAELIITPNEEFAEKLVKRGCTLKRHAHAMSLDLTAYPTELFRSQHEQAYQLSYPTQFIEQLTADELFDSWSAAYPLGHPDYLEGSRAELTAENLQPLLDRSLLGANHRSSLAVLQANEVIAAIMISLREGEKPYGGPWLSEIWCDPRFQHQGIGRALLEMAITDLIEDRFNSLGLAVSHGNPAQKLYESLGFTQISESWTIALPTK